MREAGEGLSLLMRRKLGRNEKNFGQLESFGRALGNRYMPAMDGIEGTAKKGDVHGNEFK